MKHKERTALGLAVDSLLIRHRMSFSEMHERIVRETNTEVTRQAIYWIIDKPHPGKNNHPTMRDIKRIAVGLGLQPRDVLLAMDEEAELARELGYPLRGTAAITDTSDTLIPATKAAMSK